MSNRVNFDPKFLAAVFSNLLLKNYPSTYKEGIKKSNNILNNKESITYLGLILYSKLTRDFQLKETEKKITKYCSIFSKIGHLYKKDAD